jgi:hypothetical protein
LELHQLQQTQQPQQTAPGLPIPGAKRLMNWAAGKLSGSSSRAVAHSWAAAAAAANSAPSAAGASFSAAAIGASGLVPVQRAVSAIESQQPRSARRLMSQPQPPQPQQQPWQQPAAPPSFEVRAPGGSANVLAWLAGTAADGVALSPPISGPGSVDIDSPRAAPPAAARGFSAAHAPAPPAVAAAAAPGRVQQLQTANHRLAEANALLQRQLAERDKAAGTAVAAASHNAAELAELRRLATASHAVGATCGLQLQGAWPASCETGGGHQ